MKAIFHNIFYTGKRNVLIQKVAVIVNDRSFVFMFYNIIFYVKHIYTCLILIRADKIHTIVLLQNPVS